MRTKCRVWIAVAVWLPVVLVSGCTSSSSPAVGLSSPSALPPPETRSNAPGSPGSADAPGSPGSVSSELSSVSSRTSSTGSPPAAASSSTGTGRPADGASYSATPCWKPNYPGAPFLDLGANFRCGYLTVPENRTKPDGRKIRIAVAIVKAVAATPKADPLLYLTGGPGGTGIVTAQQRVAGGINADRDVIFIDQRGTYHSDPRLSCPEIDEFASKQYALDFFASATIIAGTAATEACRKRLTAQGYDLDSYNTAENAADVADLRVALGIKSWNIYGVSYGNDLALSVLRDHPEGIRSEVLDSVVPPQANLQEGFWAWPAEGYANLFAACAAQPACHTAYPHLSKEFFATVRKLTAKPLLVGLKLPSGETERVIVDGYALANAAVLPSLGPGLMTGLPAAIHAIANGDGRTIAEIVASQNPSGVIGWGLALGVLCGEQVAWTTPAQALASARKALPEFPISVLTPRVSQAPMLTNDCRVWNVPKLTPDPHRAVTSELPVLLMSGSLDAAAPPGNAKQVAAELSNSQSVVIPGSGHDVLLWDRRCSQPIMNAFLNDPTKTVDTTCAKNLPVPPFTTK